MTAITHQSPFAALKRVTLDGAEYWDARELMTPLGYDKWENFLQAIYRAMDAADNIGLDTEINASRRQEPIGKTIRTNFHLSRHFCHLIAMNGDPRKPEIAAAQSYFSLQTIYAEQVQSEPAPSREIALPQDYASALRELAATVEREAQLEAKVAQDAPKVGYVDAYVADADLLTLRTVAGSLDVKETDLRQLLIERGWIYFDSMTRWSEKKQQKETIRRYSAYADKKPYFTPIPVHEAPRFKGEVMHTLKVTPQGAEAIARLVGRTTRELMEVGA